MKTEQPPLTKSFKFEAKVKELPSLEDQIEFMKQALDPSVCNPASAEMVEAIYQSLFGIQLEKISEKRERLSDPFKVIKSIGRPYNLSGQIEFITKLKLCIGTEPADDIQRDVLRMYDMLLESLGICDWLAETTKDKLLELPSNQPSEKIEYVEGTPVMLRIDHGSKSENVDAEITGYNADGTVNVVTFNGVPHLNVAPERIELREEADFSILNKPNHHEEQ